MGLTAGLRTEQDFGSRRLPRDVSSCFSQQSAGLGLVPYARSEQCERCAHGLGVRRPNGGLGRPPRRRVHHRQREDEVQLLHLRPALRPTDAGCVSRRRECHQALPATGWSVTPPESASGGMGHLPVSTQRPRCGQGARAAHATERRVPICALHWAHAPLVAVHRNTPNSRSPLRMVVASTKLTSANPARANCSARRSLSNP
jgi:hypothetical protein